MCPNPPHSKEQQAHGKALCLRTMSSPPSFAGLPVWPTTLHSSSLPREENNNTHSQKELHGSPTDEVTQEEADHLVSNSACPALRDSSYPPHPQCQEHGGHIQRDRAPPGTERLTSFTRCSMGCSHSVFTSQWLSRNVRTAAAATSAPRTRERISPEVGGTGWCWDSASLLSHPCPLKGSGLSAR